ncbi:hypothetical protein, partial [Streptomyces sp. NPDC088719]|uniref:hypothetical protein n=1 Tax=Streptomyces sp. NPDC088719 TaxID=3365872 RepID=UPI0038032D8F
PAERVLHRCAMGKRTTGLRPVVALPLRGSRGTSLREVLPPDCVRGVTACALRSQARSGCARPWGGALRFPPRSGHSH